MDPTSHVSNDEIIMSVMEEGTWYTTHEIADLLGVEAQQIYKQVQMLEKRGKLNGKNYNGKKRVQLRQSYAMPGPMYMPPLKELTGYDLGVLRRLCEGSRKKETGLT